MSDRTAFHFGDPRLPDRFWSKAEEAADGCWTWRANLNAGYGMFWLGTSMQRAHRLTYLTMVGPIPEPLVLDHLCRNRACCNPAHLEPVSHQVNLLRGETKAASAANRTHCNAGHEFTAANTYRPPYKPGKRVCRTCHNERTKLLKRAAKAAA